MVVASALLLVLASVRPGRACAQEGAGALSIPEQLRDLPLVLVPASGPGSTLAVMISGDGGWAAIDRAVAATLAESGIPVVGLNALKYLWTRRTPDEAAQALARVLRYYLAASGRKEVLLVGYSLGADVLPFMAARLPAELRRQVRLVALLGASQTVDFKFHVAEWFSSSRGRSDLLVQPAVDDLLRDTRVLCVYGAEETDTVCPALVSARAEVVKLEGAHHFDGGYPALGRLILRALEQARAAE
ncbi:MAG TPA: AcvB/VirJ family lysyl-phosphatidylglycerol hydrolase [Longimicrobiales bacterium]